MEEKIWSSNKTTLWSSKCECKSHSPVNHSSNAHVQPIFDQNIHSIFWPAGYVLESRCIMQYMYLYNSNGPLLTTYYFIFENIRSINLPDSTSFHESKSTLHEENYDWHNKKEKMINFFWLFVFFSCRFILLCILFYCWFFVSRGGLETRVKPFILIIEGSQNGPAIKIENQFNLG